MPQFHFVSRVLSLATNDEQYYIRTKPVSSTGIGKCNARTGRWNKFYTQEDVDR